MSSLQKTAAAALLILLAAVGYGLWYTHSPAGRPTRIVLARQPAQALPPIDQATLATAQRLAALATSDEERALGQSAVQLADHELDLAYAAALRQIEAHPPVLSPQAQLIETRLQKSQQLLGGDQAKVAQLTAALAQTAGSQQGALQDQLELARSQLELDEDEVQEANADLLEAGGNLHQLIQTMIQQHATAEKAAAAASRSSPDPLASLHGLVRRLSHWFSMRSRREQVDEAAAAIADSVTQLGVERRALAARLEESKTGVPQLAQHTKSARGGQEPAPGSEVAVATGAPKVDGTSLLATTRQIAADQRLLTLLDERISARRDLAQTYEKWRVLLTSRAGRVLHDALQDVAIVLGIILALLFVDGWLERLLRRTRLDRRQLETLRSVLRVALQIVGIIAILLLLVGVPGQLGTMLGIAGAGLTVALKDFIVAFIGWLVLMGKNGIRLGDWVEINGVSGEVVELGMFHTVLLETGNWTEAGHPTGRRVTFTNSFAIQGHYFNFSTSGQWLWDELLVLVPYGRDPHVIADAIHNEVLHATAETARQAEQEWRRAVRTRHEAGFSAAPGIIVRPAVGGVEVAVRYVTRASERFALRTRLYQSAVHLLAATPAAVPA
jgi:small-conductance mechanosensitive channel